MPFRPPLLARFLPGCRRGGWLAFACVLVLVGVPLALPRPAAAGVDGEAAPREVAITTVLAQLRREVAASFRRGNDWPRDASNFARERNWSTDREQLYEILLRPLDRNPVVDGYIKWQLLSFEPDFEALTADQWRELIARAPEPLSIPSPQPTPRRGGDYEVSFFSGRQLAHVRSFQVVVGDGVALYRPRVGVISSGGILGVQGTTRPDFSAEGVVQLNRELADARHHVRRANGPVLAYRDALLRHATNHEGMRFAALLREIGKRLDARDGSARDVLDELLEVGPELIDALDESARVDLMGAVRDLARRDIPYTRAFDTNLRGELVANVEPLALPRDKLEKVMLLLRDPAEYRRVYGPAEPEPPADDADDADEAAPPIREPLEPEAITDPTG